MATGSWSNLGGIPSGIADYRVGANADGRLEAFAINPYRACWHIWQVAPNDTWLAEWQAMGTPPGSQQYTANMNIGLGSNKSGRLELFSHGIDPDESLGLRITGSGDRLSHIWQKRPNGTWSNWSYLTDVWEYGEANPIVVASNHDGRLEVVFSNTPGDALWHKWQSDADNGWADKEPITLPKTVGAIRDFKVLQDANGDLVVFALTYDTSIDEYPRVWRLNQKGGWSDWRLLGELASGPVAPYIEVQANLDGRFEFFIRDEAHVLWHRWENSPGGTWSDWASFDMPKIDPSRFGGAGDDFCSARNSDGRLELFAQLTDGAVWHAWQTSPNANDWSDWDSLGGNQIEQLRAAHNQDGRLEIFGVEFDTGSLLHRWQTVVGSSESWND